MRPSLAAIALASTGLLGCGGTAPPSGAPIAPAAAENPALPQARELLKAAESAPLPTPLPPPSPLPRGWTPQPAPEMKPEEVQAIRLLEQVAAAEPGNRPAHELLARALEPFALRRYEREAAARAASLAKGAKGKKAPPPQRPDQGIDTSPARVAREYRAGVEADPATIDLIDPMIAFASKIDDLDTMQWAHQELIRRAREKDTTGPVLRYGDFLRDRRRDPLAAAEQYRGALIWMPNDPTVRGKLADIYLGLAKASYERSEFSGAEVRIGEAARFVDDPASPQGRMLADYRQRLTSIRR